MAKIGGVWAKIGGVWAKIAFCWQKANFRGKRKMHHRDFPSTHKFASWVRDFVKLCNICLYWLNLPKYTIYSKYAIFEPMFANNTDQWSYHLLISFAHKFWSTVLHNVWLSFVYKMFGFYCFSFLHSINSIEFIAHFAYIGKSSKYRHTLHTIKLSNTDRPEFSAPDSCVRLLYCSHSYCD